MKDNEKVYDERIAPLMTKIIGVCKEHEIPMSVTRYVAALRDGSGIVYLSESGVWMAPAAFVAHGTTQKIREFGNREAALCVAEQFAARAGCVAVVESVRR